MATQRPVNRYRSGGLESALWRNRKIVKPKHTAHNTYAFQWKRRQIWASAGGLFNLSNALDQSNTMEVVNDG